MAPIPDLFLVKPYCGREWGGGFSLFGSQVAQLVGGDWGLEQLYCTNFTCRDLGSSEDQVSLEGPACPVVCRVPTLA